MPTSQDELNQEENANTLQLQLSLRALLESGLETQWRHRADSSDAVNAVVAKLQELEPTDYQGKLVTAGFTPKPYVSPEEGDIEQSCATCMYFERHRQFCDLPELKLPVMPDWSCVLWRI